MYADQKADAATKALIAHHAKEMRCLDEVDKARSG